MLVSILLEISIWSLLEMVLVSVQDRCTVCARCTIGSVIILDEHDGTLK
jgi:hypothetical protein